jgi:putative redox protein
MGIVNVSLSREGEEYHFVGRNEAGHLVHIDDATAYEDGTGSGTGPMQLLLMALAGCSGVDIVSILKKGRCRLDRFDIGVTGRKPDGVSPSTFEEITIRYEIDGDVSVSRVQRAVELSLGKYCSVAATLKHTARIRYECIVNGEAHEGAWV